MRRGGGTYQAQRQQEKQNPPSKGKAGITSNNEVQKKASLEKAYGAPKPKQSSIVASSKAAYAAKYGSVDIKADTSRKNVGKSSTTLDTASNERRHAMGAATGTVTTAKKIGKPVPKKEQVPVLKSKVDIPQKSPQHEYDYGEDDFEEDYQSDFEEEPGADENVIEELEEADNENVARSNDDNGVEKYQTQNLDLLNPAKQEVTTAQKHPDGIEQKLMPSSNSHQIETSQSAASDPHDNYTEIRKTRELAESDKEGVRYKTPMKGDSNEADDKSQQRNVQASIQSHAQRQHAAIDFKRAANHTERGSKLKRSHQLMSMVRLHAINAVTTLHLDTNPEKFLFALSGKTRHNKEIQLENLSEAQGCQTEPIRKVHKWTQRPPAWSSLHARKSDVKLLREESLGVGTERVEMPPPPKGTETMDNNIEDTSTLRLLNQLHWEQEVGSSWNKIAKFITRSSRKVLYVLESQKRLSLVDDTGRQMSEVKLGRGLDVFNNLDMSVLSCSGDFVACGNFYPAEKSQRKHDMKTVITVWSLKEPSNPKYLLRMWGRVTTITVYVYGHVAVAGEKDGGIAIWDLDESTDYHKEYHGKFIRNANIDTSLLDHCHKECIIGLYLTPQGESTSHMLSMDRSGLLKLWTLSRSPTIIIKPTYPQNTAYWSKLDLVYNLTIDMKANLQESELAITCFKAWTQANEDVVMFAFGTANGFTVIGTILNKDHENEGEHSQRTNKAVVMNGHKENGKSDLIVTSQCKLQPIYCEEHKSWVTCIDVNLDLHLLLVGSADQTCRIFGLENGAMYCAIECDGQPKTVQFSHLRQSIIYIAQNNAIHAYDLLKSQTSAWKSMIDEHDGGQGLFQGLEVYTSGPKEFTIILLPKELQISNLCGDMTSLHDKEHAKLRSILSKS